MAHHQSHTHTPSQHSRHGVPNPIQVQKYLGGVDYPASKQELLDRAQHEGANQEVLDALERIPDQEYSSPAGISRALGQLG